MRPYLLKGHERPLTQLKYNREGDLLFSCARDQNPTLWFSENGQRVGTYVGHNGQISTCDVSMDSSRLLTGSSDSTAKLWEVETGNCLHTFKFQSPCRAVAYSIDEQMAALSTDPFMAQEPAINIVRMAQDSSEQSSEVVQQLTGFSKRITRVAWTDLNRVLVTAGEDGYIRRWDVETGTILVEQKHHEKEIRDMCIYKDGTHLATASTDKTVKLIDTQTLDVLRVYQTDRPANAVALSPIFDQILIGGGQDAADVTTTNDRAGGFQSRFFHKIFMEEIGSVRGHFGPVNAIAIHPDGRSFATGGEDGYVRINPMQEEKDYLVASSA
ncbi:g3515 [Coccomyxa viridis]|uniref:Eukaryotic translation initiation factor 3 subunit I n=1 Tax=Coccomyxa viridis TaxID=1274662 RepID=A0ABP1FQA5_9CHLO